MTFKDHFSDHSADYASHRPTYPPALFEYLARLTPRRTLAWDCATGNGQAAGALARHFESVIATDASAGQIACAKGLPDTVELRVAQAEDSAIAAGTVDLVTVAQALHWFDFDRFYAEVFRVLAPGGVLAVWTYALTQICPEIDALIERFYRGEIDPYWPPERQYVEDQYRNIPFPFAELDGLPELSMAVEWTASDLLCYLNTWSAVQRCRAATDSNPVDRLKPELVAAWGTGRRQVRWPIFLRVGKTKA